MGHRVTYDQYIRLKQIEKQFGTLAALDALANGFNYGDWPVIVPNDSRTDFDYKMMKWALLPASVADEEALKAFRKTYTTLNTKAENILSGMSRDAALHRRSLISTVHSTHFYEWRHYKPEGENKEIAYPYVIELQPEFFFATIWQPCADKSTGEVIDSFSIVTTKANEVMEEIHNKKKRQPTILPKELAEQWLFDDLTEEQILKIAAYQLPSEEMRWHTIAKDFLTSDDPFAPFDYPELPEIEVSI